MKKYIVGMLACMCVAAVPSSALADGGIKSIALDPATACIGEDVDVTVIMEPFNHTWASTKIEGACFDHADHAGEGSFTQVFTITAPGSQGAGNIQVKVFEDNVCGAMIGNAKNARLTSIVCLDDEGGGGDDCTVIRVNDGAEVCCGDSCVTIYDGGQGEQGDTGEQGDAGIDGSSCSVSDEGDGRFLISCEDGTSVTIHDGRNGTNGADGLNCWDLNGNGEKDFELSIPHWCHYHPNASACQDDTEDTNGDGEIDALDCRGLNCWDLNENGKADFCNPELLDVLGLHECPESYTLHYSCEDGEYGTQAMSAAMHYEGDCDATVSCVQYMTACINEEYEEEYEEEYYPCFDEGYAIEICGFTEDTNSDGAIDALDCRGSDGSNGADGTDGVDGQGGANGTNGQDGADGADGISCIVVDNNDATCTIECVDSSVTIHNCGVGTEPEPEPEPEAPTGLCGSFGGVTILGMLLPLFVWRRKRHW